MQFSKLYISLVTATLITEAVAFPFKLKLKRDDSDDEGPVIVHLTKTVQNVQTNIHTVQAQQITKTNVIVNTNTETVTRYTATVTSTVFGQPHTYTTVATTPVQAKDVQPISQNEVKPDNTQVQTAIETTAKQDTPETTAKPTPETTEAKPTPQTTEAKPTPQTTEVKPENTQANPTTTAEAQPTSTDTEGPTITNYQSIPTSTDGWIIDNINTVTSAGVCIVNYDYYGADDEADETVTYLSTVYTTVTRL
jgi:outer membrane biosynthesis protein TonB